MLTDAAVIAFAPTTDLERAREFYTGTLRLELLEVSPFAVVLRTGGGTMLRVTLTVQLRPQPFTVLGWAVEDIAGVLAALRDAGVPALRFDGMTQDDDGVWLTPGGDRVAWFHDPDGNTLSLTQFSG